MGLVFWFMLGIVNTRDDSVFATSNVIRMFDGLLSVYLTLLSVEVVR